MTARQKSEGSRETFQTSEQKPDENSKPTMSAISSSQTMLRSRTFVMDKMTTGQAGVQAESDQMMSRHAESLKPASYARFVWIDSPTKEPAQNGDFQPPKRRRVERGSMPQRVRLNAKKPLKIAFSVNEDVWRVILSYCEPRLLLSMRFVSRMFRNILKESRIWKESREVHFGTDVPGCPFYLSEVAYTDLLVGSGCQSSHCLRRETRKANWIFRGRLCENCLRQKTRTDFTPGDTMSRKLCPELFSNPQRLGVTHFSYLDLIPTAYHESGKYYAPRRIDSTTGKWYGVSHRTHGLLYLKSDHQKLMHEITTISQESWSFDKIIVWALQRYESALRYGKVAEEMMHWETSRMMRWDQVQSRAQSERDREMFFIRKAAELPNPMPADLLPFFAAYQSALLTLNRPSERSWQLLLPKILPYREEAEKVKYYQQMQPQCHIRNVVSDWSDDGKLFMQLHDHRHLSHVETGQWTLEQKFIRQLGRDIFQRLDGRIADDDLVLMCLRMVHDTYQKEMQKPHGLNYDGSQDVYKLSLDDARMIVEDIIQPEVDRKTLRFVTVLRSFRCAGCTRIGVARKFTFRSCFEHIRAVHSVKVGKDLAFSKYARNFISTLSADGASSINTCSISGSNFPWYIVEWTKTLPILPQYTVITKQTKWDPASDDPYIPRQMHENEAEKSAFDKRQAVRCVDEAGNGFQAAFVAAVKAFDPTDLDVACVVKIALRYAKSLRSNSEPLPTREELLDHLKAAKEVSPRLMMKFRCGLCSRQPSVDKHMRCARTPVEISRLYSHWHQKHKGEGQDIVKDFLDLPSDSELLQIMKKHDLELQVMQTKSRARETFELAKTYRKKPDHKSSILMQRPKCMDAFEHLFPHTGIEDDQDLCD